MCGIAGVINCENNEVSPKLITKMTDYIVHRGPDDQGHYFGQNFALGHRRLSIIDLSNDGHQPMTKEEFTIVYNGEIFNYIEIRDELILLGYKFNSETDTEVVIAAYKEWGGECQNRFNGMWSFILYDATKNILFCSRDRFNMKPFYYCRIGNQFLIGSEIKQFLSHNEFQPSLEMSSAFDYLVNGLCNHNNKTFFNEVYSLQGGHQLIYDLKSHEVKINQWYIPNLKNKRKIDFEMAKSEYLSLLKDSVKLRMRSDVEVGCALSGGLDSSSLARLSISNLEDNQFKAISSCYTNKDYDESEYAEKVVENTKIELAKIYPDMSEFFQNHHEKIVWHQDQPLPSGSHFSEFSVFEKAGQEQLKVMICGQGPDEHSAGYTPFFNIYNLYLLRNLKLRKLASQLKANSVRSFLNFLFLNKISEIINPTKTEIINYGAFNIKRKKSKIGLLLKNASIRNLSIEQIFTTSIPYQAHSEDRNSMMHSVESRSPYLDHRIVEFALSLPDEYKIEGNKSKHILREAVKDYIPNEVYSRTDKMGFVAPDVVFFKESPQIIRPQLIDAVENLSLIITEELIIKYDNFVLGCENYDPLFFRVLSLNTFVKKFNVQLN